MCRLLFFSPRVNIFIRWNVIFLRRAASVECGTTRSENSPSPLLWPGTSTALHRSTEVFVSAAHLFLSDSIHQPSPQNLWLWLRNFFIFFLSLSLSQKQRYFSQIAFGLAFLLIMTRGLCRIKSLFKAFSCKPQSSCKKSRQITHFTAIFLTYCEIIKNAKWNMHLPHPTWLLIITKYHSKVYNVRNHENENSCQ